MDMGVLVNGHNCSTQNSSASRVATPHGLCQITLGQVKDYVLQTHIHAVGRQRLRSATQQMMVVPRHRLSSVGCRAFGCKAPWSGIACRMTPAHSRTMSPLDSAWKPGFSLAPSVLSALETSWQLQYINSHYHGSLPTRLSLTVDNYRPRGTYRAGSGKGTVKVDLCSASSWTPL